MLIGVNSIFSLRASSCFIISYPLNFFMIELDRFRVTLFLHSTFFFNQKPKLVPSLEKFQKKCTLPILCSLENICQKIQIRSYQVECHLLFQVTLRKNPFLEHHLLYLFLKFFLSVSLNFLTDFSNPSNLSNPTYSLFSGANSSGCVSSVPKNISSSSHTASLGFLV